ncbi:MAG: phosphomannomutase [Alphaproteobacteria bacterium 16-39-46]|nr:MAG: phosphomannomutase [Alphaproteobacteria bacterium 16-39-46]OZA41536.1 MAG: phosphomannomutase [Alphaproteobacteria bacterium 17-39-52]HQS84800.1 phosphomannomutase/phosphoglucomutase [Alphaproteobacteria bacterium]HQS94597.1 phosphomannomutase/phosphoglucomutase [Alphaproteobacteria bacterium]
MHTFHPSILREYDIRGVFNETLFPEDFYAIGRLFAQLVREKKNQEQPRIGVGFDGRLSTPHLVEALHRGLLDEKAHVISIGCGPTPMTSFAHYALDVDAVLMVTGSHNPANHNGVKMTLQKHPFYGQEIQNLSLRLKDLPKVSASVHTPFFETHDLSDLYVDKLLEGFDFKKPLKVVWDAGNGSAGEIIERLVKHLPGTHVLLNTEIDGNFPAHHPDPTLPENLEQLKETILDTKADLGLAFDGDGDRLGVMDGKGRILWGDQVLILLAEGVLKTLPGAPIIADVKASQLLFDKIKEFGGVPIMERTGHSLIKSKMREMKAPLAGEMSGHIFFADRYYGYDDALYAALRLLEILNDTDKSLSDLYEALPKRENTPEIRIDSAGKDKKKILNALKEGLLKEGISFNDLDGLRVSFKEGWWGIRASNTQDVLTIRVEADTLDGLIKLKKDLFDRLKPFGIQED